jgi:hypothetical protein
LLVFLVLDEPLPTLSLPPSLSPSLPPHQRTTPKSLAIIQSKME